MNFFEPTHLIIVALVVLVLFGPKKIPELMRGLGSGVGELKKGLDEGKRQLSAAMEASTETPTPSTASVPVATPVVAAVSASDPTHAYEIHDHTMEIPSVHADHEVPAPKTETKDHSEPKNSH
jgi:sec-independent protein translocase protein TatA